MMISKADRVRFLSSVGRTLLVGVRSVLLPRLLTPAVRQSCKPYSPQLKPHRFCFDCERKLFTLPLELGSYRFRSSSQDLERFRSRLLNVLSLDIICRYIISLDIIPLDIICRVTTITIQPSNMVCRATHICTFETHHHQLTAHLLFCQRSPPPPSRAFRDVGRAPSCSSQWAEVARDVARDRPPSVAH